MDEEKQDFSEFDCNFIVKHYDTQRSGSLNYKDFRYLVLPREVILKSSTRKEMKATPVGHSDFLPKSIEQLVCKILQLEIDFQRRFEMFKIELERLPTFSL